MGFAADLQKLVNKTKLKTETVVRKVALELQNSIVLLSPVDTGQFRANWQCGIGELNSATTTGTDKTGGEAFSRTQAALDRWEPGQTIWLTNSLPQAKVLEYGLYGKPPGSANGLKTVGGFSKQAPSGMVRLTVQNYGAFLADAVKDVQ